MRLDLKSGRYPVPPALEFGGRLLHAWRARMGRRHRRMFSTPESDDATHAVTPGDWRSAWTNLGIKRGAVVMLHSSGGAIQRLGWDLSDFIDLLQDHLGPSGTLVMPTHPQLKNKDGRLVYHVQRSPSRVGMVTELFRRRSGVIRSRYPFAAAAASGPLAAELIEGHAASWAPHDESSPYGRLSDLDGHVLCVGTPIDRATILHVPEDVLRNRLSIEGFHIPVEVWVRDGNEVQPITTHRRAPWLWWYLALYRWSYQIRREKLVRETALGPVSLRSLVARRVMNWMHQEYMADRTIYPLAGMNRWLRLGDPPHLTTD